MSVKVGRYKLLSSAIEEKFGFVIEDPIDPSYNPAYNVLIGEKCNTILYEFKRAYLSICYRYPSVLSIPYIPNC